MSTTMTLRATPAPSLAAAAKDVDDGCSSSLASSSDASSLSRSGLTPPTNVHLAAGRGTTTNAASSHHHHHHHGHQPVLYSAIGSLENSSLTNMGSFQKRLQHQNKSSNNNGRLQSQQQIPRPPSGYVESLNLLPPLQTVSSDSKDSTIVSDISSGISAQFNNNHNNKKFNFNSEGVVTEEHTYDTSTGLVSMMAAAQIKDQVNAVLFGNGNNSVGAAGGFEDEKKQSSPYYKVQQQQQQQTYHHQAFTDEKRSAQTSIVSTGDQQHEQSKAPLTTTIQDGNNNNSTHPTSQQQQHKVQPTILKKNIKQSRRRSSTRQQKKKHVTIDTKHTTTKTMPVEMFRPSCDAYTPRMDRKKNIKYQEPKERTPAVKTVGSTMGTISRPNFRDALRRVAMIIHQHIVKIERRFDNVPMTEEGLFKSSMRDAFSEDTYITPRYKVTTVRVPMARPGVVYGMRKIQQKYEIPTGEEIYEFAHQLFKSVQLSSECSIVCLIYVERLMEVAKVPLLRKTWRPIFMCGLLLASKIWQDLSSWNIEFASVYPQYSLDAINKLELQFLKHIKWDLYISSSLYAKYYFALRSLLEKKDFRNRYNRMVGVGGMDNVAAQEALKIQQRTEVVKEETLLQFSRSM